MPAIGDSLRGPYAEEGLRGEHERPQVEALLRGCWHPLDFGGDKLINAAQKVFGRQRRKGEPLSRANHSFGVLVRTEGPNRAVGVPIRLEPLEHLLGVVQHSGRRVE
jgi:hypothetical protein